VGPRNRGGSAPYRGLLRPQGVAVCAHVCVHECQENASLLNMGLRSGSCLGNFCGLQGHNHPLHSGPSFLKLSPPRPPHSRFPSVLLSSGTITNTTGSDLNHSHLLPQFWRLAWLLFVSLQGHSLVGSRPHPYCPH
jgi:hypothetical protein